MFKIKEKANQGLTVMFHQFKLSNSGLAVFMVKSRVTTQNLLRDSE